VCVAGRPVNGCGCDIGRTGRAVEGGGGGGGTAAV